MVKKGEDGVYHWSPAHYSCFNLRFFIVLTCRFTITYYFILFLLATDEEKKSNATYTISVARKLGCTLFMLPEDIMEVNTGKLVQWFLDPWQYLTVLR